MSEITPETPTTQTTPRATMARRTKVLIGAGAAALLVLGGTGIAFAATDGFEMDDDDRTSQSQSQEQNGAADSTDDNRDNRDNSRDDDYSSSNDPEDAPISDADRAKVEAAGLKAAGGDGKVTDLERSDDLDHAWEVEVTFADGRDVDVELAEDFSVTRVDKN